ncbi:unnamed protein product [Lepeophtheirus salmonis]|uniref:(salmon louse) hypothetical protein n=1 Tax=Lepeophtheirus salmonis TaxID=72036 RepID=A0A7R8CLT8_LEPSM|nr:unnamed protein product [Lepeophtheirus salmonis]CAF2860816.1 unnamed protein product [Lepeophtheirus salmonis]
MANTLIVPKRRSRGSSLPGNIILDQEDIYRLRNFSMAGKKSDKPKGRFFKKLQKVTTVLIQLDRALNYEVVPIAAAQSQQMTTHPLLHPVVRPKVQGDLHTGILAMEQRVHPLPVNRHNHLKLKKILLLRIQNWLYYKVAMLGASGVGKSALTSQFLSSDDMNTYDSVGKIRRTFQKTVSLSVDGNESKLVFIDHSSTDMSVENQVSTYEPDGYIVVYAIDESETGKAVAIRHGCKYIETSPGINHNVDELLVGMLTQIQLRINHQASAKEQKSNGGFKILDLMEKMRNWTESLFSWIIPNSRGSEGDLIQNTGGLMMRLSKTKSDPWQGLKKRNLKSVVPGDFVAESDVDLFQQGCQGSEDQPSAERCILIVFQ